MFNSIKSKLLVWSLSVFSILFSGLGFFLYYELKNIVIGSIDSHLHSDTQLLTSFIEVEKYKIEWELDKAAVGDYTIPFSGHYYQIALSNGTVIAKSPSLADKSLPFHEDIAYQVLTIAGPKGEPLRLMNYTAKFPEHTIIIQAAESLEDTYRIISSFKNILIILSSAAFVLSGIGIISIAGLSLKTLTAFSRKISSITEENLNERIDERGVDREIISFAVSFNNMMTRIEEAFAKQRQFLSDASHELRTPTSVIKSYCDVTLRKERNKNEYEEALTIIKSTAENMAQLIQRILDIARLEGKNVIIKKEVVDIGLILEDVFKLMFPIAQEREIELSLKNACEGIKVSGDKERLTEVFLNIVDNAIKYNKKGGGVVISSETKNGSVIIAVSDTGIGIPEEHQDKLFDRFYRIDDSREEISGAGLGLSIAKAIVNAHGGNIEVHSKEGVGSEFKIYLQLAGKII
ncbi:MAG: HAMP domain-containing histidine kinase [Deltaproteobacteria bacterium]|nr:HAMP domain-containing histidine kinase [Deltaproteobacteria bacterium]